MRLQVHFSGSQRQKIYLFFIAVVLYSLVYFVRLSPPPELDYRSLLKKNCVEQHQAPFLNNLIISNTAAPSFESKFELQEFSSQKGNTTQRTIGHHSYEHNNKYRG